MKTILVAALLLISLAWGANSLAVSHGSSDGKSLQPVPPADLNSVLSEFAGKEYLESLLLKLNDPDPFVRVEAVQALGEIQKEEALVSVCECLYDENIYVRAYAAEALGKIGQVDISLALLRLISALDDSSPYVRAMMVAALGELQDERAVEPIRKLLHDEDESVRVMAKWALNKIEASQ